MPSSDTQFPHQKNTGIANFKVNPQNAGRKPKKTILKELEGILSSDNTITIPPSRIESYSKTRGVKIKVTNREQLALLLSDLARSKNERVRADTIKFLMEQETGRASQKIQLEQKLEIPKTPIGVVGETVLCSKCGKEIVGE